MASSGTPQKPTPIDLPTPTPRPAPNHGPSVADLDRFQRGNAPAVPAKGNKH